MLKIIEAKVENADDIVNLNHQFHLDIPEFIWDSKKWIIKEIKKNNYYLLINNKRILGALNIEKNKKKYHISTIAINKKYHRKNLGKKLIDFAIALSIKNKIPVLTVGSFCDYKLEKFYIKCGFTKEEKLGTYNGHNYYKFFMKI